MPAKKKKPEQPPEPTQPQEPQLEPRDYAVQLSAERFESATRITWQRPPTPAACYAVYRREPGQAGWGKIKASLGGETFFYDDHAAVDGRAFEYKVSSVTGAGYIYAGFNVPPTENRGKVILLIEKEKEDALREALETLRLDLAGDGWTSVSRYVSRDASPFEAREAVREEYRKDPENVNSVFILGHIPVYSAGNIAPDGHIPDHLGAWPADSYYGIMDAEWPNFWAEHFGRIPGDCQLAVGRADFYDMPLFQRDETELLINYLRKNHLYRTGQYTTDSDMLLEDAFGAFKGEAFSQSAHRLYPVLWGKKARVTEDKQWVEHLRERTFTWSCFFGPGSYTSLGTSSGYYLSSEGLCQDGSKFGAVFNYAFGSYFGDWARQNDLMRAIIAMPDYSLTCAWAGRPGWFCHHMALGETLGFGARLTQNNDGTDYRPANKGARNVHIGLMGDPTLRMYPVKPPENLNRAPSLGGVRLTWDKPNERKTLGYYIYGAEDRLGPYRRIAEMKGTAWSHRKPGGIKHYMVRTRKLTETGSGSFFNLSTGAFV